MGAGGRTRRARRGLAQRLPKAIRRVLVDEDLRIESRAPRFGARSRRTQTIRARVEALTVGSALSRRRARTRPLAPARRRLLPGYPAGRDATRASARYAALVRPASTCSPQCRATETRVLLTPGHYAAVRQTGGLPPHSLAFHARSSTTRCRENAFFAHATTTHRDGLIGQLAANH